MSRSKKAEERPPLSFRGNAIELLKYQGGEVVLSGPAGCVAGETLLWDPVAGKGVRFDELHAKQVRPWVQTLAGPVLAEVPFIKGVARLYRVTLENGSSSLVTGDHLFLTSSGWTAARLLTRGKTVLSGSPTGVRRSTRTVEDYQDGCRCDHRSCDELLPPGSVADPGFVPSRSGVLAHIRAGWLPGDSASTEGRNHPCRCFALPSKPRSGGRQFGEPFPEEGRATPPALFQFVSGTCSPGDETFQRRRLSSEESPLPQPSTLRFRDSSRTRLDGRVATRASDQPRTECCACGGKSLPSRGHSQSLWRSQREAYPVPPSLGSVRPERSDLCVFSCSHYRYILVPVKSVSYERTDFFYDLHVPVEEHYLADGMFSHNTGKSVTALFKLHALCESKPGLRCLMLRKTRASLTQSAMVTYEEKILPPNHPVLRRGGTRRMRSEYVYPNGSVLVLGGLDNPLKIMSTDFDVCYVQEAIELRESEWDSISSRLRNGAMSYQQIFADTNPDHPQHWLKQRCDRGDTLMLESKHEDNPRYWDLEKKQWTPEGAAYIAKLDKLRGPLNERLRWGRWSSAEGAIYVDWRRDKHVVPRREIPPEWPRYWAVDFGHVDPFSCLMFTVDPDERIIVYRELYKSRTLISVHAAVMLEILEREAAYWANKRQVPLHSMQRILQPRAIICDHQASERANLEHALGLSTIPAKKGILRGIQVVSERLIFQPDGRPRLEYMEGSLVHRDETLAAEGKPTTLLEEMPAYIWKPGVKDQPVDKDNHSLDALLYGCLYLDKGSSGLYEAPTYIDTQADSLIPPPGGVRTSGTGRLRFGENMDRERRGGRLFGGGR